MVSHDAVAFYLLSEEVAKDIKSCSQAGADEVFAALVVSPLLNANGDAGAYRAKFFDRSHAELERLLAAVGVSDPARASCARTSRVRATRSSTARCDSHPGDAGRHPSSASTTYDGLGLEARTPFLDHELVELAAACPPS